MTERKTVRRDDGGLEVWDRIDGRWRCCVVSRQEMEAALAEPEPEEVPEGICAMCGEPLPPGEEMFRYHGYSGPCPTKSEATDD